jgi:hypothetical protein
MAFLNISLLAGGLLMAIPVVLHLIMRQQPKHFVFPAVRFIKERRESNVRRLNLRHWLLLALRCAAVGIAALALARPSVASAMVGNYLALTLLSLALAATIALLAVALARKLSQLLVGGLGIVATLLGIACLVAGYRALVSGKPVLGDQEAPVAAVVAIDTSPRMEYRHDNHPRLQVAQETALWVVRQLPADSEVAVVDSRSGTPAFAVDRSAAEKGIERLRPTGTPRTLVDMLQASIRLAKENPRPRKEVYLFTDMTAVAWKSPGQSDLQKLLADDSDVLVYVIDVGVDKPRNFSLGTLQLSSEFLPQSGQLTVEAEVRALGEGGERTVVLQLEEPDPTLPILRAGKAVLPKAVRRGVQTAKLEPGGSAKVRFVIRGLTTGVHQGQLRLLGEDGLALDDVRYFAVEVQEAFPVLIVAPPGVKADQQARALAGNPKARFECDVISQEELPNKTLADYRAVCLLDPTPIAPPEWERLADFAAEGGGVAVVLGHNAQPLKSFQDPTAIKLLGGKLTRQTRSGGDLYLAPVSFDHPLLAEFRSLGTNVPWDHFPIFYHWNLDDLAPTARTIIAYGNNKPALVENSLGRGRVLTLTTPLTDIRPRGRAKWNDLWAGDDAWPAFMLWNEMLLQLVGTSQSRLNYTSGETAVLDSDPETYPQRYQLFTPLDEPQYVLARDGRLAVRFTDNPGAYRLRGQKDGPLVRGFAVNLNADTTDLTPMPRERLDEILGPARYQFASDREDINRAVGNDRVGSEFYSLLVGLLALTLALEHTLANRFYKRE